MPLLERPTSLLILLTTAFLPFPLRASPSIDISLQASFPAPPFLLELLESAAHENASSYLPILDHIASNRFYTNYPHSPAPDARPTDSQLFQRFRQTLKEEGYVKDEAGLSSWEFALAAREAAPRIEAGFQFYRSSVEQNGSTWHEVAWSAIEVWRDSGHVCLDVRCEDVRESTAGGDHSLRNLQFDRLHGDLSKTPMNTVYIDITSPDFGVAYGAWRRKQLESTAPFRIRYKPPRSGQPKPLLVNGYGVELALKRTDYIVIDDRDADEIDPAESEKPMEVNLHSEDVADLKRLSSSELLNLGVKAASFILGSEDPYDTLSRVSQDFPKHAAALALHTTSMAFLKEHRANRDLFLPPGYNVLWVNGVQIDAREVDAFSLLENLRRERKLVEGVQELGFTAPEAISILSHPNITETQATSEPQRYDYRDETEGENIILWLNDIEKDRRYADWPKDITALLQRTFPGQLPSVRKDIHNVVFPVDLSDRKDVIMVVEQLQNFIKRLVPVRFGIVPIAKTEAAKNHAKVVYHLNEAYGLAAVMNYLRDSVSERKLSAPNKAVFTGALQDRKLRRDQQPLPLPDVLKSVDLQVRVHNAQRYLNRLGADGPNPPMFANGVPLAKNEEWMQSFSQRVTLDLRTIQREVFEEKLSQKSWLAGYFVEKASLGRNPLIIPENENDVKLFDVGKLYKEHADEVAELRPFGVSEDTSREVEASILVFTDVNEREGALLIVNAIKFALEHENVEISFVHHSGSDAAPALTGNGLSEILRPLEEDVGITSTSRDTATKFLRAHPFGKSSKSPLAASLGLGLGQSGVLLNGRLVGPVPQIRPFTTDDFENLLKYELRKRIEPVLIAVSALELYERLEDKPLALVKLSSLVALSSVSDVPEGIFDTTAGLRMEMFNRWNAYHTCIEIGEKPSAILQLVASIDPASEIAQRWVPILGVLSQLSGVHLRIFLNPRERLQDLPVKRFYRHVLSSKPQFDESGELADLHAHFDGIPEETLLTTTMDVPPSWLVAPKESVHDLDNVKLSLLKGQSGIEAMYELEHILIEGHSRDTTIGTPPRGVQLVLGTENDPTFAGTIIMANLGYFQFKANPGVFTLKLQEGRSRQIFSLDSAGTMGYGTQRSDNTTEISLTSFKGATVFPRLSRIPGKELEDVLEAPQVSGADLAAKGAEVADGLFAKVGLPNVRTGDYIAKGLGFGQTLLSKSGLTSASPSSKHADINIFSVASGHLYERMLNIMMVSVMRHTSHSVKFWFIEQFLSPSFKSSLPAMAAAYHFSYEMVTYKWPHWLRAQTEKQRVIWGYKILFLDVLFPLDLDNVIFVDADQIVRTDMFDLVTTDLHGAPYGFTPMCDSRTEMEGFRFWKQGYWKNFLRGLPYHISALYVVDLKRFRQIAAGDRLRQQYHQLSADPNSLSNLDQDLPNHMQMVLPIHSLSQEWLWCETWCSDESLKEARTIDLCNNPLTKEPKLERARRQVPEWTVYDEEIAGVLRRWREGFVEGVKEGNTSGVEHRRQVDEL